MTAKRNYKTFNVQTEAHKIMNELRANNKAQGDTVAFDTVWHHVQRFGINGFFNLKCDYSSDQNANYYLVA